MKFEFNTEVDKAKEAAALSAALAVLYGTAVTEALDNAADTLAPDGHPVTVQTSPIPEVAQASAAPAAVDKIEPKSFTEIKDTDRMSSDDFGTYGTSAADAFGTETAAPPATVDTAGIPWDERIHSSTKGTNKDGTWSRRRNTPDATYDAVMAELKGGTVQTSHIPEVAEASVVPPAPTEPVAPPPPPAPPAARETVVPPPPATSTPAASPTSGEPITFPKLMVKITKAQTAGTIDPAKVLEFLGMFGLSAVKELASAPAETIQAVNDLVDAHVGA